MMAWREYRQADRQRLTEFLAKNEWGHVGFSSRFRESSKPSLLQTIYIWKPSHSRRVHEAVLYSQGLVIPVFAEEGPHEIHDFQKLFFSKRPQKKIDTVMGLRRDVEAMQRLLEPSVRASLTYHTMVLTEPPKLNTACDRIECKRARPRDAGLLYPLQRAYELEEVLLNPRTFHPGACYRNLQKNLRNETVYYGLLDGKPVAKAGTNAQGFKFAQLGGVFTETSIRNRGVAERLLSVLLKEICSTMAGVSLFVKKENHAAIALYRKLGFRIRDEFKIAYYR